MTTSTIRLHVDEAAGVLQRVTEEIRAGRLAIAGDPDSVYPIPSFAAFKDEPDTRWSRRSANHAVRRGRGSGR